MIDLSKYVPALEQAGLTGVNVVKEDDHCMEFDRVDTEELMAAFKAVAKALDLKYDDYKDYDNGILGITVGDSTHQLWVSNMFIRGSKLLIVLLTP